MSFYENDIIEYEQNGIVYKERFLSKSEGVKNKVETKPIMAKGYKNRKFPYLSKVRYISKIYTDILGNETKIYKEKFKLSVD